VLGGVAVTGLVEAGGGLLVAVEPPQAPRASVATTPMVRTRDHLVSDLAILSSTVWPEERIL
jgi:hypothetical protein